jgi:hypothetical protein
VLCLLRVAPHSAGTALAAADVIQRVVHVPYVPLQQAKQLVAAGVRISSAQLLSAASYMVAGVEVWVQALEQLGIASDLPAAVVAICCTRDQVSLRTHMFVAQQAACLQSTLECPSPVCNKLHTCDRLLVGALVCKLQD